MLDREPSARATLAGFSTGVEPWTTELSMNSGGKALGTLTPGDFDLALATGVKATPPRFVVVNAASPLPVVSAVSSESPAVPQAAPARTSDRVEQYRICMA